MKVVIVEDESLCREMLSIVLADELECKVTGVYRDSDNILRAMDTIDADVATVDIRIPGTANGFELALRLKEKHPAMGVVLLSNYNEPAFLQALHRRRLTGWAYLLKNSLTDLETLGRALKVTAYGQVMVDPAVTARLRACKNSPVARLTPRQQEVLELMVRGYSNRAIAHKLFVSRKTVENVINQIYQQMGIDSKDPNVQPRVTSVMRYLSETRMRDT